MYESDSQGKYSDSAGLPDYGDGSNKDTAQKENVASKSSRGCSQIRYREQRKQYMRRNLNDVASISSPQLYTKNTLIQPSCTQSTMYNQNEQGYIYPEKFVGCNSHLKDLEQVSVESSL